MTRVSKDGGKYSGGIVARFRSQEEAEDFYFQCGLIILWESPDREMLVFSEPPEEWLDGFLPAGCIDMHYIRFCRIADDETLHDSPCRNGAEIWQFPGITLAIYRESNVDSSSAGAALNSQTLREFGT